jgi:hypothetical protein
MTLASFFNLAGPDLIIIALILGMLGTGVAGFVILIVFLVKRPAARPPVAPPPPPLSKRQD